MKMIFGKKLVLIGGFFAVVAAGSVVGCAPERPSDVEANLKQGLSGSESAGDGQVNSGLVVAVVNEERLTLGEFERRISRLAEFAQARYSTVESKQDYLVDVVQFEVLADEAERRGYGGDPVVLQAMKDVLVRDVLQNELRERVQIGELDGKLPGSGDWGENGEDLGAEERRMIVLAVDSEAEAVELRTRIEDATYATVGDRVQGFRILAHRYSTERVSAERGGDVGFVSAGDLERKEVSEQAFLMEEIGALSQPFEVDDGWMLAMILEKRVVASSAVSEEEALAQARREVFEQRREAARAAFVEELVRSADVEIFAERLVELPLSPGRDMSTGADSNRKDQQ